MALFSGVGSAGVFGAYGMRILTGLVVVIWRLVFEMCDKDSDILGLFRERTRG